MHWRNLPIETKFLVMSNHKNRGCNGIVGSDESSRVLLIPRIGPGFTI